MMIKINNMLVTKLYNMHISEFFLYLRSVTVQKYGFHEKITHKKSQRLNYYDVTIVKCRKVQHNIE